MKLWVVVLTSALTASCMASENNWSAYLKLVDKADPATIKALPATVKNVGNSLNDEHASELATAISLALVKDPTNVLQVTNVIEKYPDELQQRFGTSLICSIPGITHYTTEQTVRYFERAEASLVEAGEQAAACLHNLRDTMDEVWREAAKRKP